MAKSMYPMAALIGLIGIVAPSRAAPVAPDTAALSATIDRLITARWSADHVQPAPRSSDAEFLRRVYFDLAGRIPSADEARTFLDDKSPDKRPRLVERLLGSPDYVLHFTNYWRSLLLPEGSTDPAQQGFAPALENWLRKPIADNRPYDQLAREILTFRFGKERILTPRDRTLPDNPPTPEAFYLARDVKPENLAAATARLFMGVRLECAQCHNHPFASWKREQFWGYAAFFAGLQRQNVQDEEGPGSVIREVFDRRELTVPGSGQVVAAAFLDGSEPRWRFKVGPRVTLADWMTAPANPFFAKAAVNRMWGYFFGVGLVDPVDDLGGPNKPSHPELLDELARQFVAHHFDLKYLMRAIVNSRTYQLASTTTHPSQEEPQRFARMAIKGVTAEQFFDSIVRATGYREPPPPANAPPGARVGSVRADFLNRFAANRGERPTEAQTSILQALALMNGGFIADATRPNGKGTLATVANNTKLSTAQRVEMLFLATLSRRPGPEESARLVKYVESGGSSHDQKQALADVFWALLNSGEFILNH